MGNTKIYVSVTNDCRISWYYDTEKSVRLDRVYIPERLRGRGLLKPAMEAFIKKCRDEKKSISMSVAPDDVAMTDGLREFMRRLGFVAQRVGKDVYRNELEMDCSKGHCLIIRYVHGYGGSFRDRKFWEGVLDGCTDVYDWNTKANLIQAAINNGWPYKVMRFNKRLNKYEDT